MTEEKIRELEKNNYTRKAQARNNYWVDFSKLKLNDEYVTKFGDQFNIIIYSSVDTDSDFYIIPFPVIKHLFVDTFLTNDKKETKRSPRWVMNIKNHLLKVSNCPNPVDIKEYYANSYICEHFEEDQTVNDYKIEDKLQEIKVRIGQSIFRKSILDNFENTCCISGIQEKELLVASHIVPWADNKDARLDPTNGLSLFILYDKLFDKGYFTISEKLVICTIKNTQGLSIELQKILKEIDGKIIKAPKTNLKPEHIKYHRENIFLERVTPPL